MFNNIDEVAVHEVGRQATCPQLGKQDELLQFAVF